MFDGRRVLTHRTSVAALMAGAGLWPAAAPAAWTQAGFETRNVADAVKAFGGSTPAAIAGVTLIGPDIAENGAAVSVVLASTLPGVTRLLLLVEKNRNTLAAMFDLSSDAVEPRIETRVKMGQSSNVYAGAMLVDGRVLYARKDIEVTLGGCGESRAHPRSASGHLTAGMRHGPRRMPA
jgi:sulfur-oxidizing protein SoxY